MLETKICSRQRRGKGTTTSAATDQQTAQKKRGPPADQVSQTYCFSLLTHPVHVCIQLR